MYSNKGKFIEEIFVDNKATTKSVKLMSLESYHIAMWY